MRASLALAAIVVSLGLVAVPTAARAGDGVAILPLVSADAELVAVLDVADARDAKMFEAGIQLMLDRASDMEAMLALVDLDLRDVNTVLIAGGYGPSGKISDIDKDVMAVIEGGFNKKKVIKKLGALPNVAVKKKRSIKYWATADFEAAVIGKRLVVTQPGGMAGVIDRSKKKAKGLIKAAKGAALRAALAYTDTRHDAWMISLPPPANAKQLKQFGGADMVTLSIGATLGSDLTLEVKVKVADEATAETLASSLTRQAAGAKKALGQFGLSGFASSLSVSRDVDVVDLGAVMTSTEVSKVLDLMAML